jgi:histidine triad (HIT) family protein
LALRADSGQDVVSHASFLVSRAQASFSSVGGGNAQGLVPVGGEAAPMSTVFTKILTGEWSGHFVYRDDRCAAFLSINPIRPGHTLVVPVQEVAHWVDLDPDTNAHLMKVAQKVGKAQMSVFQPERIGMIIAGFEVPHTHLHVVPVSSEGQLSFAHAAQSVDQAELAAIAARLSQALEDGD